jgi:hypothetical protein
LKYLESGGGFMKRYLTLLMLLLLTFATVEGSPAKAWYDPLELRSAPQADVKSLEAKLEGQSMIFQVSTYSGLDDRIDYYTGRIFLDLKEGGSTSGEVKGADYQLAFYMNPKNMSGSCAVLAFNDVKLQWEETKAASCSIKASGDKLMIDTDLGKYVKGSFRFKAYFDILAKDSIKISYLLSNSGRASIDGDYAEYKIPQISGQQGNAIAPIDYKEVYVLDDLSRVYLALVPSSQDGVKCELGGPGAKLTRNYFVDIDVDMNETNGVDLTGGYSYECTFNGRKWFPFTVYAGTGSGIMIGKAVEFDIKLLPVLSQISTRGGKFGIIVRASMIYRDYVPDTGWLLYDGMPDASSFEVIGANTDVNMNKDLSTFKSIGSASGIYRIALGGPGADSSYQGDPSFKFLKRKDGLYGGVEFNGKEFWASYGRIDYAVIKISRIGEGYYCSVAGVTRYGTRAGLIWLSQNMGMLSTGTYLIGWIDNGNGIVEMSEISLLAGGS